MKVTRKRENLIHSNYNQDLFDDWKRHSGISDILSVIEDLKNKEVHFKIPKISFFGDNKNPVTEIYSTAGNSMFLYYNVVRKEFFFKPKFAFINLTALEEPEEFVVGENIKLLMITDKKNRFKQDLANSTFAPTVTRKAYQSGTAPVRGLYILDSDEEEELVVFDSEENPEVYFDDKLDLELTKKNLISLLEEQVKKFTITKSTVNYFLKTYCLTTHQPISYKFLSEEEKILTYKRMVKGIFCMQEQFVTRVDSDQNFIQKISDHIFPETVTEEILTEIVSELEEYFPKVDKPLKDYLGKTLTYIKSNDYPNRFFPEGFEKVHCGVEFVFNQLETK